MKSITEDLRVLCTGSFCMNGLKLYDTMVHKYYVINFYLYFVGYTNNLIM